MQIFIKNVILVFCAVYYYFKLLIPLPRRKNPLFISTFPILLSSFSIFIELHSPCLSIPLLVLSTIPLLSCYTETPLSVSVPAVIISYGISYTLFTLSTTVISILLVILFPASHDNHILIQLLVALVILLAMPLPFFSKRLKKGMPFLKNPFYRSIGVFICSAVLFLGSFLNNNNYDIYYLYLFVIIYFCTILIYLYWHNHITRTYLDRLHDRSMADLNTLLEKKSQYITELEQENRRLSQIIHKDNKLIPAMEYAVKTYLTSPAKDAADIIGTGNQLLIELQKISSERKNILQLQNHHCQKLASTGITSTDNLLQYMQQKASEKKIGLNTIVSGKLTGFINHVIEEQDVNTLIADLVENALTATECNGGHSVLIHFGKISNACSISIFDSGIPFDKEIIRFFGLKQITTHADDSGSGIGLMTTSELIQKYSASLIINEFPSAAGQFTKEISVLFNGLNQFILKTGRDDTEIRFMEKHGRLRVIKK
ncbi:MAG: hypothetical protein NC300_02625 [Bacteroidales bacterium]|nr:hypothetical protein [Clostridium sp.]MCM1203013.1 hypothetical protein [Bacteroidales bacterium]